MPRIPKFVGAAFLLSCLSSYSACALDTPLNDSIAEEHAQALFHEIRCVVCQGETIADSPASVAEAMRVDIRRRILRGDNDQTILDDMATHYGDTILMRPPLKSSTALLWFGPLLIVAAGLALARLAFKAKST